MRKVIVLVALLATACGLFPARRQRVSQGLSGTPGSTGSTGSPPVVLQLDHNGAVVPGLVNAYSWPDPSGRSGSGMMNLVAFQDGLPAGFPGTLVLPVGQSVAIMVSGHSVPPGLIVAELNAQGLPLGGAVLPAGTGPATYIPAHVGRQLLQVTAQWSLREYITFLFELEVLP